MPPLRERPGDVPILIDHFLREAVETSGRQVIGFDRQSLEVMTRYAWPGNVRQLENVVERAVLLSRDSTLTVDDLPPELLGIHHSSVPHHEHPSLATSHVPAGNSTSGKTLRDALEGPEREIILRTLREHHWNRAATAEALDINRTTLYKKMKRLGLDDPRLQFA